MITQLEREASSLRICCELVGRIGAMTVVDVCVMTNGITEDAVRKALARGIELGYLKFGEKKQVSAGKGNARKTYVRTRKQLPGVVEPAPEPVVTRSEFAPFRHWMDAALFGPYEGAAA